MSPARVLILLALCLGACLAQTCAPATTSQPVVPILRSTQKNLPVGRNSYYQGDDGVTWTATFDIKNCNPFPVPLGACLLLSSPITGSNVTVVGSLPAAALPAYNDAVLTVQLSGRVDNITVTIVTSAGPASASSGNGSPTGSCSGVGCGNLPLVPASVRLCANPCPAGSTPNAFWTPPHPLLSTRVIQPVPAVTCGAQSLAGKNCLVVGGAHGAGRGIAQALYADGCNVIATSRRPGAYASLTAPSVHPAWLDVRQQSSIDQFFDNVIAPLPSLDIVVSTPGVASFGPMSGFSRKDLAEIIEQNCLGHFGVAIRALEKMGPSDGYNKIFIITSTASFTPVPFTGPYSMSKFAARAMAISLYEELNAFPRYNLAINATLLDGSAPLVYPSIVAMAPESMNTDWGLYESYKGTFESTNDPRTGIDRGISLGYLKSSGMPPFSVGTQILAVSTLPNDYTRAEYMVYNPNPASTDTIGQDLWNSAAFNLPVDEFVDTMFYEGLGGFGFIAYGGPQNVEF